MNTRYITATLLLLILEFFLLDLPEKESVFWIAIARIIAAIILTVWYYQHRKPLPTLIDKLFILTLILPIPISLCVIFFPALIKDFNLIIHACILCLWAGIFKLMGSKIKYQGALYKFLRVFPIYAIVPLLFYIFTLHTALPVLDKILLLCYAFIYIYTSTLASFLPISESDRFWISWSVVLMAFANFLVFYSIFIEQLPWLGFIPRTIVIVARCILILGMVDYFAVKQPAKAAM
ncbi:hypothetical protein [Emticicia agri]|nr:hypothetical protein [Emticicia agri]